MHHSSNPDDATYSPTPGTDDQSQRAEDLGQSTQLLLANAAQVRGIISGQRVRKQAVQYSPSLYNQPARVRNTHPSGPAGILPNQDISAAELPGWALINVDRYAELARDIPVSGFRPLIEAGAEDERVSGSPLNEVLDDETYASVWEAACNQFFCSMDEDVLIQVIAGNIDLAYRQSTADGTALAHYLDKVQARSACQPSCYVRPLTDANGNVQSLDDYEQMLDAAERYYKRDIAHATEAFAIDSVADKDEQNESQDTAWSMKDTRSSLRRHLQTNAAHFSDSRAKVLRAWIAAGRARISRCRTLGTTLTPPMQYVGYAMNAQTRRKGHENRNSASWLSLLALDICQAKWPDKYSLRFFVICLIFDQALGQFSEIVLSRYLRAYVVDGGLSIDWAGKSTDSLTLPNLTPAARADFWQRKQDWIHNNLELDNNIDKEFQRCRAYRKQQMLREIAELDAELQQNKRKHAQRDKLYDDAQEAIDTIERYGGRVDQQTKEALRLAKEIARG